MPDPSKRRFVAGDRVRVIAQAHDIPLESLPIGDVGTIHDSLDGFRVRSYDYRVYMDVLRSWSRTWLLQDAILEPELLDDNEAIE